MLKSEGIIWPNRVQWVKRVLLMACRAFRLSLDGGGIGACTVWHAMRLFIALILSVAWLPGLVVAQGTNAAVSVFRDRNLEAVVRQQVFSKRNSDQPLTASDVANVAVVQGSFRGIADLAGLEHCKALALVELAGNQIVDLTPLSGLRHLQSVHLASNRVEDITALGTLPALQYIQLEWNSVMDPSPLSRCTNLASVYLSHNRIRSIRSLTNLPRLVTLYADNNRLKDVDGIEGLRGLSTVSLADNRLKDVGSISRLRAPSLIILDGNRIRDLTPLVEAARADLAGSRTWAPFVGLHLKGNRLSAKSKKRLADLEKEGVRVVLK